MYIILEKVKIQRYFRCSEDKAPSMEKVMFIFCSIFFFLVAQLIFIADFCQVLLYRTFVYHFRITIIILLLSVTITFDS